MSVYEVPAGKHCDDLIDDQSQPECLRNYLRYNRLPASCQCAGMDANRLARAKEWIPLDLHQHIWSDPEPVLFADYQGKRVRVVMASRLGDVGITEDLGARRGYSRRVLVCELSKFSEEP